MTNSTTTKYSAIFLAAMLFTGTIALSSPSFMLGAQAEPYYGMDKRYDNYGSHDDSYGQDSYDKKPYSNDDYGQESYDKEPYSNDDYGQDYPSYKPIYKKDPYGKDRDNDKSKDSIKSVSITKLKCINTNININGNNTGDINLGNKDKVGAEEGGYVGGYSYSGGSEGYNDGYDKKKDKSFECIINNNNNNTNIGAGGGNQTVPPVPPEKKATLNVTKLVTCEEVDGDGRSAIPDTPIDPTCTDLLGNITENQFNITVTDTNPTPSQFPGSETGTNVTLGAGAYTVTETFNASLAAEIEDLGGNVTGPNITFTGNCIQTGVNSTSATGNIVAGGSQTCNIENNFVINLTDTCPECIAAILTDEQLDLFEEYLAGLEPRFPNTLEEYCQLFVGDTLQQIIEGLNGDFGPTGGSPVDLTPEEITALALCIFNALNPGADGNGGGGAGLVPFGVHDGGTGDSHELTAMEKITKLKTQWLNQLP